MYFLILILFLNAAIECKPYGNCDSNNCINYNVNKNELCDFCYILLPLTRRLIETNQTIHFRKIATNICRELKIADSNVCNLAIKTYEVYMCF